jgi:hypothetical protein
VLVRSGIKILTLNLWPVDISLRVSGTTQSNGRHAASIDNWAHDRGILLAVTVHDGLVIRLSMNRKPAPK